MTGKRSESGGKAKDAGKPESKPDEATAADTPDASAAEPGTEKVIDAEFSEELATQTSAKPEPDAEDKAAEKQDDDASKASDETAAGVAALALAAGSADKQEAERNAAAAEEKTGPGGLVYGWLALLSIGLIAALYILIVNPTYLRDRMGLAQSPEILAQASATREASKAAEVNANSITANEAAISELQTGLADTDAATKVATATATKAVSIAEAAQLVSGEPDADLKASVSDVEVKLEKLEASLASVRAALAKSSQAAAAGDPIDGLALAAAAEAADAALAAAEAAQAAASAADAKASTSTTELNSRLDDIAASVRVVGDKVAALEAKANKRGPVSLAQAVLALQDLRTGVDSGKPFATLLGRAQSAFPEASELNDAPWVAYANDGLPTTEALTADMQGHALGIAQDKLKARLKTGENEDSWLDRAVGGVVGRLKVRRVGAGVKGDDPAAVAARAEAALQEGDLNKAIQEVETLEGADAERFAEWLKQAKAAAAASNDLDALQKAAIAAADGA